MFYFRFVTNTFVLGVVEVKLGEEGRIVKRKQEVRGIQYSLRCIGEFDVKTRQNVRGKTSCRGGCLLVTWRESEKELRAFDLLRVVSYAVAMVAW
jgi:hypothetical protein